MKKRNLWVLLVLTVLLLIPVCAMAFSPGIGCEDIGWTHDWGKWECWDANDPCTQWSICNNCSQSKSQTVHTMEWQVENLWGCTYPGSEKYVCARCGYDSLERREIPAHHDWTDWRQVDGAPACHLERVCMWQCGAREEKYEHQMVWTVEKPADCIYPGSEKNVCALCGYDSGERREIPTVGSHVMSDWTVGTSVCVQTRSCRNCAYTETRTEHVNLQWTTEIYADCSDVAYKEYACLECGEIIEGYEFAVTPTAEHKWSEWELIGEADCTENGAREHYCTACGKQVREEIPAVGHQWSEWIRTAVPTCTEEGAEERRCKVCGAEEENVLPKMNHHWECVTMQRNDTDTEDVLVYQCTMCGEQFTEPYSQSELAANTGKLPDAASSDDFINAIWNTLTDDYADPEATPEEIATAQTLSLDLATKDLRNLTSNERGAAEVVWQMKNGLLRRPSEKWRGNLNIDDIRHGRIVVKYVSNGDGTHTVVTNGREGAVLPCQMKLLKITRGGIAVRQCECCGYTTSVVVTVGKQPTEVGLHEPRSGWKSNGDGTHSRYVIVGKKKIHRETKACSGGIPNQNGIAFCEVCGGEYQVKDFVPTCTVHGDPNYLTVSRETCTEIEYTCSACGEIYSVVAKENAEHTWVPILLDMPTTCESRRVHYVCSVCGTTMVESTPSAHDYQPVHYDYCNYVVDSYRCTVCNRYDYDRHSVVWKEGTSGHVWNGEYKSVAFTGRDIDADVCYITYPVCAVCGEEMPNYQIHYDHNYVYLCDKGNGHGYYYCNICWKHCDALNEDDHAELGHIHAIQAEIREDAYGVWVDYLCDGCGYHWTDGYYAKQNDYYSDPET